MSFVRPASFDDFAFVLCCSWATQIRKAMLGDAGYPGHAPPNYVIFQEANPHAISAARGNAAIDAEIARVQRASTIDEQHLAAHRAIAEREHETDKLSIPVAALKIILDHDTSVARLHTSQIQAAVTARRPAPPPPPRFWYNRRARGGRNFARTARRTYNTAPRSYDDKENEPPVPKMSASSAWDVPMRDATPALATPRASVPSFGRDLTNFSFGEFAQAAGSSAFPVPASQRQPTPVASETADAYDYEDYDMTGEDSLEEQAPTATGSVVDGLANLDITTSAVKEVNDRVLNHSNPTDAM
ncbi:hypothetical protein AURDEDRAFT_129921 [Auricularia subglabra TFB-10046 SS5]|uniref:Uncharacterized protein n=1 Tax=Auricularia subglabra (strain TFB-10046 / SS5) TaxID=717982 RepID=J0WUV7_AURST|nr:hypothetical protein AURDEDRAFT_129921 [Auricularia subglabra TFB-10046 SS5]